MSNTDCQAALNILGGGYPCELEAPHPGLAHMSRAAQAIWCSHDEAVEANQRAQAQRNAHNN